MRYKLAACLVISAIGFGSMALSEEKAESDYTLAPSARSYAFGAPENPSEAWMLAAGGRIYDNWASALDRPEPTETNPVYPVAVNDKITGFVTWRCKECHGFDYKGKDGVYREGKHATGIAGINGSIGKPVEQILLTLRDANHPYTPEMINDEEMLRLATFVSRGQIDMTSFIDTETRTVKAGDPEHGRNIFQTTCAACHGFDGRLLDWGKDGKHNYIGTEASQIPDEAMNKIMNSHTGVQMINLRAFPLSYAIDVLAYAATLPIDEPKDD